MEFLWSSIFRTECFIETAASSRWNRTPRATHLCPRRSVCNNPWPGIFRCSQAYVAPLPFVLPQPLRGGLVGRYHGLALFYLSPPFFVNPLKAIHTLFSLRLSPRYPLFHYPREFRRLACVPTSPEACSIRLTVAEMVLSLAFRMLHGP